MEQSTGVPAVDTAAMFKLSYGLFVLTAKCDGKDNGCIINTTTQITASPLRISIAVNKANFTHDMIIKTGEFTVSVLSESAPFSIFEQFGFHSGKDTDKFADCGYNDRAANGIRYVPEHVNGVISAKVSDSFDYGTHTLFIADVTQSFTLSTEPSVTYRYYFDNIKPKPQAQNEKKKGFVCKICGYVYEGDALPDDFICPLCKHGAEDFEPLSDQKEDKNMKYVCDVCGYEYDEAVGAPDHGIAPGTKWEDIPADFKCPVCGVGKNKFSKA